MHIVTLSLSATLPGLLNRRPLLDEVVTVNLVSLPEPTPQAREAPRNTTPPPQAEEPARIKPEQGKAPVALKPEPAVEAAVPARPVSLRPIKRKKRKTDPARVAREKARRTQELERQKALEQARREERRAAEEAARAREALAEMIRRKGVGATAATTRPSGGRREVQSLVLKQYLSTLYDRVQQYWALPEMRRWDAGLETVVVLTIRPDGSVARKIIEKKSKDPFFDQFVMKTLQKAVPLPRFPKLMTQSSIEVGLRFRPGELVTM